MVPLSVLKKQRERPALRAVPPKTVGSIDNRGQKHNLTNKGEQTLCIATSILSF